MNQSEGVSITVVERMEPQFEAVYLPTEKSNVYESTPLANAGWYDEGQHGGAFAGLIVGHLDSQPTLTDMQMSRLTVELFRAIRLVPLRIEHEVVREGKRIQTTVAQIYDHSDTLVSIATMQRLRVADRPIPDDAKPAPRAFPPPEPENAEIGRSWGIGDSDKVMFHRHAMEMQDSVGGFSVDGPGAVWMRLRKPLIAGRQNTPLQRLVCAADFVNGVSRALDMNRWVFMNPDLTVHTTRYPEGEWIGLSAESGYGDLGRGTATGSLWDQTGPLGRSTQTLYLDHVG